MLLLSILSYLHSYTPPSTTTIRHYYQNQPVVGDSVGVSVGVAVGDVVGTETGEVDGGYQRKQ